MKGYSSRIARCFSANGPVRVQVFPACTRVRSIAAPLHVRLYSSSSDAVPPSITIRKQTVPTHPDWFNVPTNVVEAASRALHLEKDHPIQITRQIIESNFPAPIYQYHHNLHPVVSTQQNFDSLGFPGDHPGRARSDTYYISDKTLLRTHTSAHQADNFRANTSEGYLVAADVYRRDAIDRSHYPVFHQMEGARTWDRNEVPNGDIAAAVLKDLDSMPKHNVQVEDPNPPFHEERNPLQSSFTAAEAEAIGRHLKHSLELMVVDLFTRAKEAAKKADPNFVDEPLQMRWIEAYFPFTSPSWELEVYYDGDWLEVLGSGVVKQDILTNAGVPSRLGWAFGCGIDRLAMLLFKIPDIRLFWSRDERFLSQFTGVSSDLNKLKRFVPFSKYPPSARDLSFWLQKSSSSPAGGSTKGDVHENDVMEIVRRVAGDDVEDVRLFDEFTHPKTGRRSMAYRIVYRSLERTLTREEVNEMHDKVTSAMIEQFGVEMR